MATCEAAIDLHVHNYNVVIFLRTLASWERVRAWTCEMLDLSGCRADVGVP